VYHVGGRETDGGCGYESDAHLHPWIADTAGWGDERLTAVAVGAVAREMNDLMDWRETTEPLRYWNAAGRPIFADDALRARTVLVGEPDRCGITMGVSRPRPRTGEDGLGDCVEDAETNESFDEFDPLETGGMARPLLTPPASFLECVSRAVDGRS